MNSVDKNAEGDYLISARFTDCIYKISGKDGSVIWLLGNGDESSFVLDGFNFSKQHDARFIEQNTTTTIISFLDNAADDFSTEDDVSTTSTYSSALLIALETSVTPMVARVIRRWIRPDQQLSRRRGNFQLLMPNRNAFTGWSDNSYITEHTYDGQLVMEAQFTSHRFATYRAYKFNFTGSPIESPTLKVYAFGTSPSTSTTVCYVSWNGATEVDSWEFYRNNSATISIGRTPKKGFETMFQMTGFEASLYVKAISAAGAILGQSSVELAVRPHDWQLEETIDGLAVLDGKPNDFLGGIVSKEVHRTSKDEL